MNDVSLLGNYQGLFHIKTQTVGNAVSSVTVTGAFSSDFDNYLITLNGGTGSTAASIGIEIGGSTTGYYGFMNYGDSATSTPLGAGRNNQAIFNWVGGCFGASQAAHVSVQVMNPFKTLYTKFANGTYQSAGLYGTMQGEHRVATSYTSFKLVPDSGTISGGSVRVYGYRNSL
jgi:hypothetical protein